MPSHEAVGARDEESLDLPYNEAHLLLENHRAKVPQYAV